MVKLPTLFKRAEQAGVDIEVHQRGNYVRIMGTEKWKKRSQLYRRLSYLKGKADMKGSAKNHG